MGFFRMLLYCNCFSVNYIKVPFLKSYQESDSTNLTYMIQWKRCKKQNIGETKRTLRERFKKHRQVTNNPLQANATAAVRAVPSHFNQPGHSIADMKLIPLELQPTLSMSRRKGREAYLIDRGKTLSPDGLNRRNEYWIELFLFLFFLYNHLPVYYSIWY